MVEQKKAKNKSPR